jgi:hypothetical protein
MMLRLIVLMLVAWSGRPKTQLLTFWTGWRRRLRCHSPSSSSNRVMALYRLSPSGADGRHCDSYKG